MAKKKLGLADIFGSVTQALAENQPALDKADEINRDHGTNMVQNFQTITDALYKKQGSSDSAALNYAARQLAKKSTSGSGKMYAEHLSQAASQFKGKRVDEKGALQLLQTLIGGATGQSGQSGGGDMLSTVLGLLFSGGSASSQSGGGDLMGALLGGMLGGGSAPQQPSQSGSGELMGALLGGMLGGGSASQQPSQSSGSDDLMGALLGGMLGGGSAQQQPAQAGGGDLMGALTQAFMSGSGMGDSSHRKQSTEVVVDSYLKALGPASRKARNK